MRKSSASPFFWSGLVEFKDHFKTNSSYTKSSLNQLANQYANVTDEAAELVIDLIEKLSTFQSLMRLNRTDLQDDDSNHQSADQIFTDLESVQQNLDRTLQDEVENIKDIYHSAIDWSNQFIQHQVDELQSHEPDSLALKWYQEHALSHRGNGAGLDHS